MTGCKTRTARHVCFLLAVLVLWATQGLYAKKKPPLHPVNINTDSAEQLQQVPGIGPNKLGKMRRHLTVGKPAQGQKVSAQPAKGALARKADAKSSAPKTTSGVKEEP